MGTITLNLEQSLGIATKEDARIDCRVLGALCAAALLTDSHLGEFDADMTVAIINLIDHLQETIEAAIPVTDKLEGATP